MPEIFRNPSGDMAEPGEGYEWNQDVIGVIQEEYTDRVLVMSSITPLYILYRSSSAFITYRLQEYV